MTRVQEIRLARGYTLAEASRRTGLSAPTIQKIEKGVNGVSRNTAPRLAEGLGVCIPDLYQAVGAPIPELPAMNLIISQSEGDGEVIKEIDEVALIKLWRRMSTSTKAAIITLATAAARSGNSEVG